METSKTGFSDSSDASNTVIDQPDFHVTNNADSTPFSLNQKVIALHNNAYYVAKVLKVEVQMKELTFYVHYHEWKSSWDEWVGLDRLIEYTEENVKKYNVRTKKQARLEKRTKLTCSSSIEPTSNGVTRGEKPSIDSITKDNNVIPMDRVVSIQIPPTLKKQLVDDCEYVNHMGKLVKLPRIPNVNDIFVKYLEYREQKDDLLDGSVQQFVRLFQSYFDKALPAMLLYKTERRQYEQAMANCISPSSVYGAEHLLRVFVKFPELLSDAIVEAEELTELQLKLVDLLKFLRKNQSGFFVPTYLGAEEIETSTTNKQED